MLSNEQKWLYSNLNRTDQIRKIDFSFTQYMIYK